MVCVCLGAVLGNGTQSMEIENPEKLSGETESNTQTQRRLQTAF